MPYVRTTRIPTAAALSATGAGIGPPPISTASIDANAADAPGSLSDLSSCAATNDTYRRLEPSEVTADTNSSAEKPAEIATGATPATTLRTNT